MYIKLSGQGDEKGLGGTRKKILFIVQLKRKSSKA